MNRGASSNRKFTTASVNCANTQSCEVPCEPEYERVWLKCTEGVIYDEMFYLDLNVGYLCHSRVSVASELSSIDYSLEEISSDLPLDRKCA